MEKKNNSTKLFVVDISSFIFRAFFAIRPLHAHDGTMVNAVYGVTNMLLKLISEHQPTHIVMARDLSGPSFRHEIFEDYKANRSAAPEELVPQFDLIKKLLTLMKMPELSMESYEADDIIGSLVTQFQDDFDEIVIASGDKDLMQFVTDKVVMLDTMKNKKYDREGVFEKMGVWPEQVVDYLSLVGDTSDNIPGVKGIGAKGASKLLAQYQDLAGIFSHVHEVSNKRVLKGLTEYKEDAFLSQKLVQIVTDLKLNIKGDDLKYKFHIDEKLIEFLESLKFRSIISKLKELSEIDAHVSESHGQAPREEKNIHIIKTQEELEKFINHSEKLYVFFEQKMNEELSSFYVLNEKENYGKLVFNTQLTTLQLGETLNRFDGFVIGHKLKILMRSILFSGGKISFKTFDILLAAFNLEADLNSKFEALAERYLGVDFKMPVLEEGLLQEKEAQDYDQQLAMRLELTKKLYEYLKNEIEQFGVQDIFSNIDTPSMKVLANMEAVGISVDRSYLKKLEIDFSEKLLAIEAEITDRTKEKINLRSPKQVGQLLFEVLEFPIIKKTKTGYSTSIEVLQELDKRVDSDIPALIMKYRELDKLLSTYIKSLPELINEKTQKVHTHYQLAVASTGRLSSDNPNLQNIPTRTENGRMIRKAFMAQEGNIFIGADYSQVELRILAHYSQDPAMVKAFTHDLDIHAQTAAEIFSTPIEEVTKEMRSKAKAINFGLLYGQSSFGLAQTLGISRKEAKQYIDHYFEKFNEVKLFLNRLKEECAETGYAKTLWGRKRVISNIKSSNHVMKAMAERAAINSPIQGTAADIIKKAMVNVFHKIQEKNLEASLLLQVHDELIIECKESIQDEVEDILRREMMEAANLSVPLKVDISTGKTWYDLK